jgi:hypothetical protein
MTRTYRTRIAVLAAALLAVASASAHAGDSAETARQVASEAPDAFQRAVARLAPAARPIEAAATIPDWPERAALSGRRAAVPTASGGRGVEWQQLALGALGGALLAALAAAGTGPLRRAVHG